jgi:UDP:flavonoid glycosyltransferase YjiC (YdhE family)
MRPLVWYVSGHGFGHASRDVEVINAIRERRPELPVIIRTGAKRWIFDLTLKTGVDFQPVEADTGIAQIDSLRLDEAETLRRAAAFYRDFDRRVAQEAEFLQRACARLVVSDIPPLAFAAAAAAGLPSIALSNFTWDWIYEGYAPETNGAPGLVALIREATGQAHAFLRLPMWGGFAMAPRDRTVDLPLVARKSKRAPAATRRALGLPEDKKLVLLSFGGHGLKGMSPEAFRCFGNDFVAILTGHLEMSDAAGRSRRGVVEFDEQALYDAGWRYEDLVAAADVVATKPGYGIIAECAANSTSMLYTSRGHFVEYEVLVREMPAFIRCRYIPQEDLFAGNWRPYLDALLAQDRPPPPNVEGAAVAAERILEWL